MGRQAASRNSGSAQKWQVAPSRGNQSVPVDCEDDFASTRMPSSRSGGASPSASSTELGRQAPTADASKTKPATLKESLSTAEDHHRWADVESDGEEVRVFDGNYRGKAEDGSPGKGKKAKNGKPRGSRAGDPPQPPRPEAPRQVAAKRPEPGKTAAAPYQPKQAPVEEHYLTQRWEASAWGTSEANAWSSNTRGGGGWEEDDWSKPIPEVYQKKADFRGAGKKGGGTGGSKGGFGGGGGAVGGSGGGGGGGGGGGFGAGKAKNESFGGGGGFGKAKNESFKASGQVSVTMDRSRLAW